ncbi:hypothetical protein M405DRAFT_831174 [Rhizopogon salebrosus TDB-379]|nr:hypothetical protein M405DRAFT_831174 [Rhizopogon salebrosus TDB-379]
MLQLIKVVAEGSNTVNDINGLPSSTGYSSQTVWMQTLAYTSLAFSPWAAFDAVTGKQWPNSYKPEASRGRGSPEERGMQRQKRLRIGILASPNRLGHIPCTSLLLFGLSLSANMLTQRRTSSSLQ